MYVTTALLLMAIHSLSHCEQQLSAAKAGHCAAEAGHSEAEAGHSAAEAGESASEYMVGLQACCYATKWEKTLFLSSKCFCRGLDLLFDGQTHRIKKMVLHTNAHDHATFGIYHKCHFSLRPVQESSGSSASRSCKGHPQVCL